MARLSIFREYDIRGVYEKELNKENVVKIGMLLGEELLARGGNNIGVGYDARVHSKTIFSWLCEGLEIGGVSVFDLGLISTPIAYFSSYCDFDGLALDGSVMITGSHNPPEYNGFKITLLKEPFFGEQIYALGEKFNTKKAESIGFNAPKKLNVLEKYIDFLVESFEDLRGLKVPLNLDFGNGVAGLAMLEILKKLEIPYVSLYEKPDGTFPNHHPDPSEEKNLGDLKALVQKNGGVGFAFDGDGDRLATLTKKRNIKGDEMAIIFANSMENPIVIGEVKCSLNMYENINKIGKAIMYKTGHSNLKVKLKEENADMAFEVSGHIFFKDRYFGYDDATYAALRVLELIKKDGENFDKILETLPKLYSTDEMKINTSEEEKFVLIDKLKDALKNPPKDFPKILDLVSIDGVRVIFEEGWGLLRASNTTPVLIARFEAKSIAKKELYQKALLDLLNTLK